MGENNDKSSEIDEELFPEQVESKKVEVKKETSNKEIQIRKDFNYPIHPIGISKRGRHIVSLEDWRDIIKMRVEGGNEPRVSEEELARMNLGPPEWNMIEVCASPKAETINNKEEEESNKVENYSEEDKNSTYEDNKITESDMLVTDEQEYPDLEDPSTYENYDNNNDDQFFTDTSLNHKNDELILEVPNIQKKLNQADMSLNRSPLPEDLNSDISDIGKSPEDVLEIHKKQIEVINRYKEEM